MPPLTRVAVGLIRQGDLFLACLRPAREPHPLRWEFPGGKLEDGESASQALRRELLEELAIDCDVGDRLYRRQHLTPNATAPLEITYYHVAAFGGRPQNRVFQEIRWARPADLQAMDFLPGAARLIRLISQDTVRVPPSRRRPAANTTP